MQRMDSHQHFWIYNPVRDTWIDDTMEEIKKDFLPKDVKPLLHENHIDGCIAVQADQSENETNYLLGLSQEYDFIKGVVGWIDLRGKNIEERLEHFSQYRALKGFRHIVQTEPQDDYLLRPDFCRGIALLKRYNFTYDILIYPKHLRYALEFIKKFPNQKFVIDHIAKPFIKKQLIDEWKAELFRFSPYKNVYCKMAGLVTEADWDNWEYSDFKPYIDIVLDVFGPERIMFGSDWPVCLTAASYKQVCQIVDNNISTLSKDEKDQIWGRTCKDFYQLDD